MRDDQRGKQGARRDRLTRALTCGFGARGRIRTDDLPITRRILGVDLVGSRRIWPAHEGILGSARSDSGACSAEQLLDDLIDVAARAGEQLVPAALLGQALLPLPGGPAAVLQPCRPLSSALRACQEYRVARSS